jgi:23S rRNA (uridine2552-2'-O)-methyltransferase
MGIYNRKDFYYKKAKEEGYRSRAAYKLIEINNRYHIIKKGDYVVDLGCAPGGFMQVASRLVGEEGRVVGIDLVSVVPVGSNAIILEGDFREKGKVEELLRLSDNRKYDVLLSDMAPHTSGIQFRDAYLSFKLAEAAIDSLPCLLRKGGNGLIKIFEGEEFKSFVVRVKELFERVFITRPDSTRKGSKEIYIVGVKYLA